MEEWILYLISIIIAAVSATFALVKLLLPRLVDAHIENVKDIREAEQKREEQEQVIQSSAFKQSLIINEKLVEVLIRSIEENHKWQQRLTPFINQVNTQMTISNRELNRLQEILDDIDVCYAEIKTRLDILYAMVSKEIPEA